MTQKTLNARLGATAIAAVLALSSTPLLAQQASDPAQPAPTAVQPSDAAPAATAPVTDTAPATTPESTAVPDTSSSATVDTTAANPAPARHTAARSVQTVTTTHVARPAPTPHAASVAAAAPAAAVAAPATAPTVAAPPLSQVAGPPPAAANTGAAQQPTTNRTAEIIGAALFALLVIGAIAFTLARRRRARNAVYEEEYTPEETYTEEAETAPVVAAPVAAAPIAEEQPPIVAPEPSAFSWGNRPADEPVGSEAVKDQPSAVPAGFDLSRFGPHVQAAYRGPTEDNPSLSLRHRLRRAAAMDQLERRHADTVTEPGELENA